MFPDITQLNKQITQFTLSYSQTQQEIITLLKAQNLLLTQILNQIKEK
jgi:hypothetical protein